MELQRLDRKSKDIRAVKRIYLEAFPAEERLPLWLLVLKANKECVDFSGIYDEGRLVGFSYLVHIQDIAYLFFYAFAAEEQGKGYGSAALAKLLERYANCRFFLALERLDPSAPNYEQRVKRHRFYERLGLKDMPCLLREGRVTYALMGSGDSVSPWEFEEFSKSFWGPVLGRVFKSEIVEAQP